MTLFADRRHITAQAHFLGQRIDLRAFQNLPHLAQSPLTVAAGADGLAVLFRYGVLVCFGLEQAEQDQLMTEMKEAIIDPMDNPEQDEIDLLLRSDVPEGMTREGIALQEFSLQRLQLVADVLAKSVILAHYEFNLARHFDRIEPLATDLSRGRQHGLKGRELLKHIGNTLSIESKMIGRVEVSEKPELIWEYPEQERLYLRLEDEYELSERHDAIDRKLALLSKTAVTLLDILQARRSLRVEWYIVILIVVEIVITLTEKLFAAL